MRGFLSIDLGAIMRNYKTVQDKIGPGCEAAAVVKADGYGLGVSSVSKALQRAGARTFFVASLEEAAELRAVLGAMPAIYSLNGFDADKSILYRSEKITPVLNSLEDIIAFQAAGEGIPSPGLHIDTGMNRLGLRAEEISQAADVKLSLVMSHFACADEPKHPMNEAQYKDLKDSAVKFPSTKKSLANSSGLFRSENYHFDIVRPGMCLYGLNPTPENTNPMQPVIKLFTQVLQLRNVKAGETCGYNATYRFEKETKVAIVNLGYADGFMRSLSNNGSLFWKGTPLPIRGRISMDLTIVDLSSAPESDLPQPGDGLEVIGPNQSVDDLAASATTIGYEVLTNLGMRYKRVYLD